MTDKQIMIDGVDVSECDRLNTFPMRYGIEPHEICLTSLEQWGGQEKYCKDRPNCYYKQLKRKEQECEELNKWLPIVTRLEEQFKSHEKAKSIGYKTYAEQVFTELDQLKAENEELKNFHINLVGVKECEIKELVKYKQALRDIKNIAVGITSTFYKGVEISTTYELLKQILQKCEVLDE